MHANTGIHTHRNYTNQPLLLSLQNFYKDINREAMYIRYLLAGFNLNGAYLCCTHVCACLCMRSCVCVCVWLYNLTRDYMSSTELMSKSTGSARPDWRERET